MPVKKGDASRSEQVAVLGRDPTWGVAGRAATASLTDNALYSLTHRCDDVDVAGGGDPGHGVIFTGVFDARGTSSPLSTVTWLGGGYGANALYDERDGAYVLVGSTHAPDPQDAGSLIIQMARLAP